VALFHAGSGGGGGSSFGPADATFATAASSDLPSVVIAWTLAKVAPALAQAPSAGVELGGTLRDTATVSGGFSPGGSITFRLFGPDDTSCAGAPVFTDTVSVTGTGDYTSAPFTPTAAGGYRWTASYSGDASNDPVTTACSASVAVTQPPTPPAPPAPPEPPAPPALTLTGLSIAPKTFASSGVVTFRLSRPATVIYRVDAVLTGKLRRGRCTVSGASRKSGRRCIRYDELRRLTSVGVAGANSFSGLDAGSIGAGRYRLRVQAVDGADRTAETSVRFRIT
jgi:hypothetical protein